MNWLDWERKLGLKVNVGLDPVEHSWYGKHSKDGVLSLGYLLGSSTRTHKPLLVNDSDHSPPPSHPKLKVESMTKCFLKISTSEGKGCIRFPEQTHVTMRDLKWKDEWDKEKHCISATTSSATDRRGWRKVFPRGARWAEFTRFGWGSTKTAGSAHSFPYIIVKKSLL